MNKHILFTICTTFVILGMSSCTTTRPMTHDVVLQAAKVVNLEDFQYYISRNVILTRRLDRDVAGSVNSTGSGKMEVTNKKDIIQIPSGTKGILLDSSTVEDGTNGTVGRFIICFEDDDNKNLTFTYNDSKSKAYLNYWESNSNNYLEYGDHTYYVDWKPENLGTVSVMRAKIGEWFAIFGGWFRGVKYDAKNNPYLLVKMDVKSKEKEQMRKVSGRSVKNR